jgi:hypothetical protein
MDEVELKSKLTAVGVELSELENKAFMEWRAVGGNPLPLAAALKLYELFLNFYSLDEIHRINGKKIPLGQIVDARVRFEWDKRRKEQLDSMYSTIEQKVVKVKNEAVVHLTDLLSAAHKIWGDKIRLFLQDGDPAALGDLNLVSFKNYKELVSLLKEMTDKKEPATVSKVLVDHTHSIKESPQKLSSGVAADLLKLLNAPDKENV